MSQANPRWGAPRIHSELLKLGFDVSERSVSRWIRRAPRDPDPVKRWLPGETIVRPLRRRTSSPSQANVRCSILFFRYQP